MSDHSIEKRALTLQNQVEMPAVAYGCAFGNWTGTADFQGFLPEQAWAALDHALDAGYRAFDGAHAYGTESILGTLLGQRFADGRLERDDLFITTKLAHPATPPHINISHLRTWDADCVESVEARVLDDFMRTLDDLRLGYVDLLMVHWPGPFENRDREFARQVRKRLWKTFASLYERGAARALGVCNFTAEHLAEFLEDGREPFPAVNQVEYHPYCQDPQLVAFCGEHDIVLAAYAPFGSGALGLTEDPTLQSIADKHGVSVGRVILRWHVQQGRAVLPKSSNPKRMRENLDLFSFRLDDRDIQAIDALGKRETQRTCPDPAEIV